MSIVATDMKIINWVKHGVIAAGTVLEVKAGTTVLGSYTVPTGKKFDATITVTGEIKDA